MNVYNNLRTNKDNYSLIKSTSGAIISDINQVLFMVQLMRIIVERMIM